MRHYTGANAQKETVRKMKLLFTHQNAYPTYDLLQLTRHLPFNSS